MTKPNGISDTFISGYQPIISPKELRDSLPLTPAARETVKTTREQIRDILGRKDSRKILIHGPCSIHDTSQAREYGISSIPAHKEIADKAVPLMRVYFEKPRTSLGWPGFLVDPHLDGSFDLEYGLAEARKLLLYLNEQGIGVATEFLDPITPPYLSDLISWTAIGARTTESQTHRNMASGLSMPVGFKNSTLGDLDIAVNAILSAGIGHAFLGVDHNGRVSKVTTLGNSNCHLVLRGGFNGANYSPAQIAAAQKALLSKGLLENVLVDCSHGNSQKDFRKQPAVFLDVLMQSRKNHGIIGLMIESNINEGQQRPPGDGRYRTDLEYGVSITDGCIGFGEARGLLRAASA